MEKASINREPSPDLYFYGRKYSELLGRLDEARQRFLSERRDENYIDKDINDALINFETELIEKSLTKMPNNRYPWHGHSNDSSSSTFFDSTGDTFIDTENKTIYRAENTQYSEDAPTQVEIGLFYSLDSLGKIQVASSSESETIDDILEPEFSPILHSFDEPNSSELLPSDNLELNLEHAKKFTEMLEIIIEDLEKNYSDPDWYLLPNSYYEENDSTQSRLVIEKANEHE